MKKIIQISLALAFVALSLSAQAQTLLYQWAFTNATDTLTNSTPSFAATPGTGGLVLINNSGNAITTIGADGVSPMLYFTNANAGPSIGITNSAVGALVANGQGYSGGNSGIAMATNLNLGGQFQLSVTFWVKMGSAVATSAQFPRFVQFTQTPAFDIGGKGSGNHSDVGASINGYNAAFFSYNQEQNGIANASAAQQTAVTITNIPVGAPLLPNGFLCDGQTWYFEAITYDGTQTTSNFITWMGTLTNDVVSTALSAPYSSINFTTNATVMIGGNDVPGNARGLSSGAIADVRFYSGVLSQSNINNIRQFRSIVPTNAAGAPVIVAQPASGSTFVGGSRTFTVGASGTPNPFGYQWKTNNTPVPGATNASLTVSNVQLANNGVSYSVTVSNVVAPTNSAPAVLSVVSPGARGAFASAVYSNSPTYFWLINEPSNNLPVTIFDYANGNDGLASDPVNMAFTNGIDGPLYAGFPGNNTGIQTIERFSLPSRLNLGNPGTFTNGAMTIAGWVYTYGTANAFGAIYNLVSDTSGGFGMLFTGAATLPSGDVGTGLTYQFGTTAASGFGSPLIVPTNEWTFVALVVSTNDTPDTNATLYVGSHSTGLQSAMDSTATTGDLISSGTSQSVLALGRTTVAYSENGSFTAGSTAAFNDVAVFYKALSPAAINDLYLTGAGLYLNGKLDPFTSGNLLLTYPMGTLQSAISLSGPFTDVQNASSPYSVQIDTSAPQVFYRLRP